ncbi:MAG: SusC/RagA family TonB-linked outer membrane protein [Bacteroidales bacterium]|nr:SusC/RagA family TonB-linked outer membrane protein [Bacteroidales bacterium]
MKKLFILLTAVLLTWGAGAQNLITVTGTVVDKNGEPVIGAALQEKGTNQAAMTGLDGEFSLQVTSANAVLHVSCIGYKGKDVPLDGRFTLRLELEEDLLMISESVVTALGIKREAKALGYAVATAGSEEISGANESNAMAALSGKLAGVDITTGAGGMSGSTSVIIRGVSQLNASNQPLYVIDGMPVDNTTLEGANQFGGYDYGDVMSSINPADIASISVLKGPSASALYGSRASNGVVLITTKSAAKRKDLGVEFSVQTNLISLLSRFDDYQRTFGQGTDGQPPLSQNAGARTSQMAWGSKLDPSLSTYIFNGQTKPYVSVPNNVMSFFRTGVTTTENLAVEKDFGKGSFRLAYTDMRNWDIVPSSKMSRQTFTFKGEAQLASFLKVGAQATYTIENVHNRTSLSDNPSNIGNAIIGLAPNFDQRYLAEGYKTDRGEYIKWNQSDYTLNPYWIINEMSNDSSRKRLIGQVNAEIDFTRHLKLTGKAGLDTYNFHFSEFKPLTTPRFTDGEMTSRTNELFQWNLEAILRYQQRFGDFDVQALLGGSIMRYSFDDAKIVGKGQIMENVRDVTNYTKIENTHDLFRKGINSWFTQASVGWREILYLDVTLRNDVTSTLHPKNRSYFYPSVSGSFVFSNLIGYVPWMSYGKLRASWAQVGGDTDPYKLNLEFGTKAFTVNGTPLASATSETLPYSMLRPTRTNSFEVGLETRMFNDRVNLDLTLYNQVTIDQIMKLPVSMGTGFDFVMTNAGRIDNRGIELSLTVVPVKTRNFSWSITNNLARNVNKVVNLHPTLKELELATASWAGARIYATEGAAYGAIMSNAFARNSEGQIIFDDRGMPTYTEEMQVLGNAYHDITYGMKHGFSYKRLWVSVLFDMKFGGDIFSMSTMKSYVNGTATATLEGRTEWYQSEQRRMAAGVSETEWVPTGGLLGKGVRAVDDGNGGVSYVPNDKYVNPFNYWYAIQQHTAEPFVMDASYIKLRDVYISYALPNRWLAKTPIKRITLTAYGRNLFILYSKLKNIDPESSYNVSNGMGLEYGSLPSRRTFGVGINVKF